MYGIDYANPKDLPTIEALIELHKQMKKQEQSSLTQVATITAEQEVTTDISKKISDIKTTLNKRMSDINSFIVMATTITTTTTKLQKLINEYNDFITEIGPIVVKKPYCSIYYANAHLKLANSVSQLKKQILSFSTQTLSLVGLDLYVATAKEKFKMIYKIDSTINQMRYIIHISSNYIKYAGAEYFLKKQYVSNEFKAETSNKLIEQWTKTKF